MKNNDWNNHLKISQIFKYVILENPEMFLIVDKIYFQ